MFVNEHFFVEWLQKSNRNICLRGKIVKSLFALCCAYLATLISFNGWNRNKFTLKQFLNNMLMWFDYSVSTTRKISTSVTHQWNESLCWLIRQLRNYMVDLLLIDCIIITYRLGLGTVWQFVSCSLPFSLSSAASFLTSLVVVVFILLFNSFFYLMF